MEHFQIYLVQNRINQLKSTKQLQILTKATPERPGDTLKIMPIYIYMYIYIYIHIYLLRLLVKHNVLELSFSPLFFSTTFPEYRGIRSKKIFYRPSNNQYNSVFVAIKGNISGLLFFWTSHSEGKFPRDQFINVGTCLFAHH